MRFGVRRKTTVLQGLAAAFGDRKESVFFREFVRCTRQPPGKHRNCIFFSQIAVYILTLNSLEAFHVDLTMDLRQQEFPIDNMYLRYE